MAITVRGQLNSIIRGFVNLGDGHDEFTGGNHADKVEGGGGSDRMNGKGGHDILSGGAGTDYIWGEAGNDTLYGGAGQDELWGGSGKDVFVYKAKSDSAVAQKGRDFIADFQLRTDKIDLRAIDANDTKAGNQAFIWKGTAAFTGTAGEVRVVYPKVTELPGGGQSWSDAIRVLADTNGDKVADFSIGLASSAFKLSAADFVL